MPSSNSGFPRVFIWGEGLSKKVYLCVQDGDAREHLGYHGMTLFHGWCDGEMGLQMVD